MPKIGLENEIYKNVSTFPNCVSLDATTKNPVLCHIKTVCIEPSSTQSGPDIDNPVKTQNSNIKSMNTHRRQNQTGQVLPKITLMVL